MASMVVAWVRRNCRHVVSVCLDGAGGIRRSWRPIVVDGIELFTIASVSVTRYRWRGTTIPSPWPAMIIEPPA
jgi:hypothetical protein